MEGAHGRLQAYQGTNVSAISSDMVYGRKEEVEDDETTIEKSLAQLKDSVKDFFGTSF